jgi:hypothetical protein
MIGREPKVNDVVRLSFQGGKFLILADKQTDYITPYEEESTAPGCDFIVVDYPTYRVNEFAPRIHIRKEQIAEVVGTMK